MIEKEGAGYWPAPDRSDEEDYAGEVVRAP